MPAILERTVTPSDNEKRIASETKVVTRTTVGAAAEALERRW